MANAIKTDFQFEPPRRKTTITKVHEEWDEESGEWVKKHRSVEEILEPIEPSPITPFPDGYRSPWTDPTPYPYRYPPFAPTVTWC